MCRPIYSFTPDLACRPGQTFLQCRQVVKQLIQMAVGRPFLGLFLDAPNAFHIISCLHGRHFKPWQLVYHVNTQAATLMIFGVCCQHVTTRCSCLVQTPGSIRSVKRRHRVNHLSRLCGWCVERETCCCQADMVLKTKLTQASGWPC